MKNDGTKNIIAVFILGISIIIAAYLLAQKSRYEIINISTNKMIETGKGLFKEKSNKVLVDKWTGKQKILECK